MTVRSEVDPEILIPVDIRSFRKTLANIHFDVFLKISSSKIVHIFSQSTGIDTKRLAHYIQQGVEFLYIHPEDEEAYRSFIKTSPNDIFQNPDTSIDQKVLALNTMTEQNMAEIMTQFSLSEETAEESKLLMKNYVQLMINQPDSLAMLLKLASHGEYLYSHSIAVSVLSMLIAKASGQFNQRMLELVGLGGFLHDIGCTQLPKEVICSPISLTEAQWKEMHAHPAIGMKVVEATKNIPDEVRYIIYQHHEQPGGEGYPNGIRGPVIYYPAKIVALADTFSALVSQRPFRPPYGINNALAIIEQAKGKYDRDLVQVLISKFGSHS